MKLILDKLHNDHINFIKLLTFLEWLKWTMIEQIEKKIREKSNLDDVVMDRLVVESGYYLMKEKLVRLHFIGEVVLIIFRNHTPQKGHL